MICPVGPAVHYYVNVKRSGGNVTDLDGIDGVSQWQTLTSTVPSASPRREFLYNIDDIYNNSAIRLDQWKLIQGISSKNQKISLKYKVKTSFLNGVFLHFDSR